MPLDLTSVWAKLGRAYEHAHILQQEIRAWFDLTPYSIHTEASADFTKHSIIAQRMDTPEPSIEKWTLIFGDAVHNLRAVLDHLIYAVAVHQSGQNPPPNWRSLSFIIEDTDSRFAHKRSKWKVNPLTTAMWTAIESVQPYHRTNPDLPPFLRLLADLDNADKHRLLSVIMATPSEIDASCEGELPPDIHLVEQGGFVGELKARTEVVSTVFSGPAPDMQYRTHLVQMVVAVRHAKRDVSAPEWRSRTEALALFLCMYQEVRYIIDVVVKAAA